MIDMLLEMPPVINQKKITIDKSLELKQIKTGGLGEQRVLPSLLRLFYNYLKAKYRDWKNNGKRVSLECYIQRLDICKQCADYRNEDRCTHPDCGCFLSKKAWYASERCPNDNKWENAIEP